MSIRLVLEMFFWVTNQNVNVYLWDVVVPPFTLLLLQLDGDASDRPSLDTLHQMGHIPTNRALNINILQTEMPQGKLENNQCSNRLEEIKEASSLSMQNDLNCYLVCFIRSYL